MTKSIVAAIIAALLLGHSGANAADTDQLAASAGLTRQEAAGMSLEEIARLKFNADTRRDDAIAIRIVPGAASPSARGQLIVGARLDPNRARSMSLTEIVTAKVNREAPRDDQVIVVSARNAGATASASRSQLSASTGLDMNEATLQQLHVAKINAERRPDDQVAVR